MYNKRTKSHFAVKVKVAKEYTYIPDLLQEILEKRANTPGALDQPAVMSASDPRRISATLAGDDPPSVAELVQRHSSRMKPSTSQT